ncbi:MAG: orotate phosphoribosyltransferase [Alphaproteobacteria bacterium]
MRDLKADLLAACMLIGEFRLRSGQTSDRYFDKYQFESDPKLLAAVATAMTPLVPREGEILAGLELGGVPVATALALQTGLPAAFVRKEAKAYGTCRLAEGVEIAGRNVVVVEDVVTTGGQVLESTQALRERGAIVETALCVMLRDDAAIERFAEHDLALRPLFVL